MKYMNDSFSTNDSTRKIRSDDNGLNKRRAEMRFLNSSRKKQDGILPKPIRRMFFSDRFG